VSLLQGKLTESERLVSDQVAADRERGIPDASLRGAIGMADADLYVRNVPARGLARIEEALAAEALDGLDVLDRPYLDLVAIYAGAGRVARARELLSEYRRDMPPDLVDADAARRSAGLIALAEGRPDEAIAEFLNAEDGRCTRRCPDLARAYHASGRRDSALAVMERFVTTPELVDLRAEASHRAWFYERLGQLYDESDDLQNAAKYYAMFVELWAEADDELQPRVRAAQARLEEILREIG
jgi:tetratricopeptide (TPR) repeat protein